MGRVGVRVASVSPGGWRGAVAWLVAASQGALAVFLGVLPTEVVDT